MPPPPPTLASLRQRLDAIDAQLLALIAERQAISGEIAEVKQATGLATRDYGREREVLLGARTRATEAGVSPELAEQLMRLLIRSSLTRQEQSTVAARGTGSGRRALVIGGAGKMGRWFVDFLLSQGFAVDVADPAGAPPGTRDIGDFRTADLSHDFIIVAAPLGISDAVLRDLAQCAPTGVVFDIGSLKTPLRQSLLALRAAGVRATSVHPMYGPDTELLSGRHVIFIDLDDAGALSEAQALFAPTMAEQVVMDLDEHDRLIAYVLGLSHAVNIAFFSALADSGEAAPRLARLSSTTFDAQLEVASRVAEESPDLYFEIQRLNDHGRESLDALSRAITELRRTVDTGDEAAFEALMLRGREYLTDRRAMTPDAP
jgi:chorismate mutase/prephenate dehydrogenase